MARGGNAIRGPVCPIAYGPHTRLHTSFTLRCERQKTYASSEPLPCLRVLWRASAMRPARSFESCISPFSAITSTSSWRHTTKRVSRAGCADSQFG